jgi:hypothetical protein
MDTVDGTPVIDDTTTPEMLYPPGMGHGAEPRENFPPIFGTPPSQMKVIPSTEWSARIKEKQALKSQVSDVRKRGYNGRPIPYLNQANYGYCWAHSSTHCVILRRALDNQPYVNLSAYSVACKVMNFRDRGGWCGLSLEFIKENGIVPTSLWPNAPGAGTDRSLDNPANWAEAKKYTVANDWVDLDVQHYYYQRLRFEQVATCLLNNEPCALDFNWWGHSVCGMDLVEVEPGSFGIRILNSWAGWGDNGEAILRGDKAVPNSAVAIRAALVA